MTAAMSNTTSLQMLMHYNAWANMRLFRLLATLDPAEVTRARKTGAGSISRILSHAYAIDLIWKGHLEHTPHGLTSKNMPFDMGLADLQGKQSDMDDWYIDYVECLADQKYDEEVSFTFIDQSPGRMTRSDILHHVVNHKTYHRGYVADILYQMDLQPPSMDLSVFLNRSAPR